MKSLKTFVSGHWKDFIKLSQFDNKANLVAPLRTIAVHGTVHNVQYTNMERNEGFN